MDNGTTGTRRPLWCTGNGGHTVAVSQPLKSVNSASIQAKCLCNIHKDIEINKQPDPNRGGPDCGVKVMGPGCDSQGEYIKNKLCCEPLITLNENKIAAICEKDENGNKLCRKSRGEIYKDLRGALANSDYTRWVAKRAKKPLCEDDSATGKKKSACKITDNESTVWPDKNQLYCC